MCAAGKEANESTETGPNIKGTESKTQNDELKLKLSETAGLDDNFLWLFDLQAL